MRLPPTTLYAPNQQQIFQLAAPLVLGGTVSVKFADVTQIRTAVNGLEFHLLKGKKQLDSFAVPPPSQKAVQEALRVLCPNAEWK